MIIVLRGGIFINRKINRYLEIFRWLGVAIGIFLAFYWGNNALTQFNIFAIFSVIFIAGFTAIEGMFFSESAGEVSGYGEGGAYQRQSALYSLALTITMIVAVLLGWGFHAYLGLLIFLMIFLTLSSINHLYTGMKDKIVVNSILRPILTILLWIITLYFLLPALHISIY
jgi:hypothetical protein